MWKSDGYELSSFEGKTGWNEMKLEDRRPQPRVTKTLPSMRVITQTDGLFSEFLENRKCPGTS